MNASRAWVMVCVVVGLLAGTAFAVNIQTVPVGDVGNMGELSGSGAGGYGPDRICGSVGYTYNIGKYEVTAGQYTEFLNKVAATDTYGLYNTTYMANTQDGSGISRSGSSGSYTYSVDAAFVNRPVNYVSYWDACRFANWMNNGQSSGEQNASTTEDGSYTLNGYNGDDGRTIQRNPGARWSLPTEDEWYKAAYYKGGSTNAGYWDYPTSSDSVPGRDLNDVSGNNANYYGDPFPIQSPYYTTVAGEFQNSDSPYGTFDQCGNVWEWNESIVYPSATDAYRGWRGGSFCDGDFGGYGGNLRASFRDFYGVPTSEYDFIGFRVSEVPEPTMMAFLGFGGIGMLVRRRGQLGVRRP